LKSRSREDDVSNPCCDGKTGFYRGVWRELGTDWGRTGATGPSNPGGGKVSLDKLQQDPIDSYQTGGGKVASLNFEGGEPIFLTKPLSF